MWLTRIWQKKVEIKEASIDSKQQEKDKDSPIEDFQNLPSTDWVIKDEVYPRPEAPITAITTEALLRSQSTLIQDLMTAVAMSDDDRERYLWPIIRELAGFVHLLPASRSHHHNGRGGLFRHSLETALYAVNIAKNQILDVNANPVDSYRNKTRWYVAIAVAGLLHDVGKCITDMTITAVDRPLTWLPTVEKLSDWIEKNNVREYFCTWRLNRQMHHHECASAIAYVLLVPLESRCFIEESHASKLKNELYESLAGVKREGSGIASTVRKADQISTGKDLMRQFKAGFHPGVNTPVVVWLEKIMQELCETHKWTINEPNSALWVSQRGIFLIWHRAVGYINRLAVLNSRPSIPLDPNIWLDHLTNCSIIETRFVEDGCTFNRDTYWPVLPLSELQQQEANNERTLNFHSALKLNDDCLLFVNTGKPAPTIVFVEGEVLTEKEKQIWRENSRRSISNFFKSDFPAPVQAAPMPKVEAEKIFSDNDDLIVTHDGFYPNSLPYPEVSFEGWIEELPPQTSPEESGTRPENEPHDNLLTERAIVTKSPESKISENELLSPSQKAARNEAKSVKKTKETMPASDIYTCTYTHKDKHTTKRKKDINKEIQLENLRRNESIEALFTKIKEQMQRREGDLIEDMFYRDDCIYCSIAPIERELNEIEVDLVLFVCRLKQFQREPILHINDEKTHLYMALDT